MYQGFQITCGCYCSKCHRSVRLEGYSDANGTHYCAYCDDYVKTNSICKKRTPELVAEREKIIIESGALDK